MDGNMHDGEAKHMQASEVSDHAEIPTSGAQGRDQIRVWKGGFYLAYVVPIKAGEDIYKKTVTYFQDREKFPACFQGHPCMATILSVTGCVSNPMLELGGSAICFEGSRPVLTMSGLFSVDKDGQAQQRGKLQITFPNADGRIFGGPVTGSLTAATPMQVTVSFFTCEEGEGEEEEEEEEQEEEEESALWSTPSPAKDIKKVLMRLPSRKGDVGVVVRDDMGVFCAGLSKRIANISDPEVVNRVQLLRHVVMRRNRNFDTIQMDSNSSNIIKALKRKTANLSQMVTLLVMLRGS